MICWSYRNTWRFSSFKLHHKYFHLYPAPEGCKQERQTEWKDLVQKKAPSSMLSSTVSLRVPDPTGWYRFLHRKLENFCLKQILFLLQIMSNGTMTLLQPCAWGEKQSVLLWQGCALGGGSAVWEPWPEGFTFPVLPELYQNAESPLYHSLYLLIFNQPLSTYYVSELGWWAGDITQDQLS